MFFLSPPWTDDGRKSQGTSSAKSIRTPRSTRVALDILAGRQVLIEGTELARQLWNGAIDSQHEYYQQTGRYARHFLLRDELRKLRTKHELAETCFDYLLRRYSGNLRSSLKTSRYNPAMFPPKWTAAPQPLSFKIGKNAVAIGEWIYRLTVLSRHVPDRYAIVKFHVRPGIKMRQVEMILVQPDLTGRLIYYLQLQPQPPGFGIAGVDLGICNLATVAFESGESVQFDGRALLALAQKTRARAKKCRPSGWKKGLQNGERSTRHRAYWLNFKNSRRLALHNLTTTLIGECRTRRVGTIVIGNLTYIRQKRANVHTWPFRQLTEQITYKAQAAGIRVVQVSERYTSQRCHRCGEKGQRTQNYRWFTCQKCGVTMDADVNGAFNIRNKQASDLALARINLAAPAADQPLTSTNRSVGQAKLDISPTYTFQFTKDYRIV